MLSSVGLPKYTKEFPWWRFPSPKLPLKENHADQLQEEENEKLYDCDHFLIDL